MEDLPINSIPLSDLLTIMYVLTDDWYQQHGRRLLRGKPGLKPSFSDSEVITLLLALDFVPFPGESQFLGFIRANYLPLKSCCPTKAIDRALNSIRERIEGAFNSRMVVLHSSQYLS